MNVRYWRDRQIFFGGSSSECNSGPNVFRLQTGKIGKNFFNRIAASQTCKNGPKRNPSAPKNRLAAADFAVAHDATQVTLRTIGLTGHNYFLLFNIIPSVAAMLVAHSETLVPSSR